MTWSPEVSVKSLLHQNYWFLLCFADFLQSLRVYLARNNPVFIPVSVVWTKFLHYHNSWNSNPSTEGLWLSRWDTRHSLIVVRPALWNCILGGGLPRKYVAFLRELYSFSSGRKYAVSSPFVVTRLADSIQLPNQWYLAECFTWSLWWHGAPTWRSDCEFGLCR